MNNHQNTAAVNSRNVSAFNLTPCQLEIHKVSSFLSLSTP